MIIHIINGPNLNLTGKRESTVYGTRSFEDFLEDLRKEFPSHRIEYFQSNHEGEIIDALHKAKGAVVLNPGGYSHTSVAIADAIAAVNIPVIEVHISNIHARESFRQRLLTGSRTRGVISGFGLESYRLGILACLRQTETSDR